MAHAIRSIFVSSPVAISRLGGSTVQQDAYARVEAPDLRMDGETTIVPTWSLNVPAGSVDPVLPTELTFHDEDLSRPVCPFFEGWALVGDDAPALPEQHRMKVSDLTTRVGAHNLKAASRTRNPDLGFGTYPPVDIAGDNYSSAVLFGVSPPDVRRPLIPRGRNIPFAPMQVLLSQKNRPDADWKEYVNLEVIRLRFTPVRGRFYGPLQPVQGTRALPFHSSTHEPDGLAPRCPASFSHRIPMMVRKGIATTDLPSASSTIRAKHASKCRSRSPSRTPASPRMQTC